jgi:diguanylate cyclase (GGDEF)-like protein
MEVQILEEARAFRQEILLLREWVATNKGVYVKKTNQQTDPGNKTRFGRKQYIQDTDGEIYHLRNSSHVTKALSMLSQKKGIVSFKATSMNPINPDDTPDQFEVEALHKLRAGETEVTAFVKDKGESQFRYMTPFVTTAQCMKCHESYGYKVGQADGALSLRIPTNTFESQKHWNILAMVVTGLSLIALVAITLFVLSRSFMRKLAEADQRLHKMATEDPLTGLFNRRMGMNLLQREISRFEREGYPIVVMMLDIDHFKRVNDRFGHLVGDQCIQNLAENIRSSIRDYDLAFRYGGEEFVIVTGKIDTHQALKVAQRLRKLVEAQRVETDTGEHFGYTISLGIAGLQAGQNSEQILNQADAAMYQAKQGGRNRCVVFAAQKHESGAE